MKKIIVPVAIASLALCGCASAEVNAESTAKTVNARSTDTAKTSAEYPDDYDDSAVKAALTGDAVETDSTSLKVDGTTVFTYSSGRPVTDVVIASEDLKTGETYTVYVDGSETGTVTITSGTSTLNRTAGGMNGMGGGRGGMHGNMNGQNAQPGQQSSGTENSSDI